MRTAVATGAVVASMVVGLAPSAIATTGNGVCSTSEICAFKYKDYQGGMADIGIIDSDWHNDYFSTGGNAHNSASSGFALDRAAQYFGTVGFAGRWFILGINEYDSLWSTNQRVTPWKSFNFNNQISSAVMYIP